MNITALIVHLYLSFVRTVFDAAFGSYVFVLRSSPVRTVLDAFVCLLHTKATRQKATQNGTSNTVGFVLFKNMNLNNEHKQTHRKNR